MLRLLRLTVTIRRGIHDETGLHGKMFFERTLEDWINFKIDGRTAFDLTISSGLALLAAQKNRPI